MSALLDWLTGQPVGTTATMAVQLPQTQKDLNTIAQVAPALQEQIKSIGSDAAIYGQAQLVMQALSTAAILGMFMYTVWGRKK